jgi:hypothetical protein
MQHQAQVNSAARPAAALVSSTDVNGTDVYSPAGDHLGHIDHLMIDKVSGNITYAVMHFGGFLGIGEEAHPIPWKKLRYDVAREGYVTDITKAQLEGAPDLPQDWRSSRDYERRSYDYYGIPPYWV